MAIKTKTLKRPWLIKKKSFFSLHLNVTHSTWFCKWNLEHYLFSSGVKSFAPSIYCYQFHLTFRETTEKIGQPSLCSGHVICDVSTLPATQFWVHIDLCVFLEASDAVKATWNKKDLSIENQKGAVPEYDLHMKCKTLALANIQTYIQLKLCTAYRFL